ncbi:hypothetical protein ACIP9H_33535 [Streptomyces sp. NPDC088732]|uniref:hypothetical protein n=1 Tax=Streptomyces sp. NPDC088732 TaxID=3365879 RepID=UPI00380BAD0B
MDGQPAQIRTRQQQTNVVERTRGVELLLGLGYERPELLLTGKVLADQAAMVDGLLASQWPREMILTALLRPLPPSTRSVGAVISRRLQDLAVTPVPQPVAMPEPRSPEGGAGYWERYEDSKASGVWLPDAMASGEGLDTMVRRRTRFEECQECRDPVLDGHGSGLCPQCRGWVKCPLCSKFVPSGEACRECEVRPDEVEFESCPDHGDRFVKGTSCFLCGTGR